MHKIRGLQLKLSNIKKTYKPNVNSLVKPEDTKDSYEKWQGVRTKIRSTHLTQNKPYVTLKLLILVT